MSGDRGKDLAEGSFLNDQQQTPSRYESQKRRDWNAFVQYLQNHRPPVPMSQCNYNHVLDFLRYLDQFGKTKVHLQGCMFYGQPEPPAPCTCPLQQAWGSLDALIGRLRAAYEEHGTFYWERYPNWSMNHHWNTFWLVSFHRFFIYVLSQEVRRRQTLSPAAPFEFTFEKWERAKPRQGGSRTRRRRRPQTTEARELKNRALPCTSLDSLPLLPVG